MVNTAIRLSDCISEYLASCASHGDRPNTLRSKQHTLDKLLNSPTGSIFVRNIGPHHIDSLFDSFHRSGLAASSINLHRSNLVTFFKWAQQRRYITSTSTPMAGTRTLKQIPRKRITVPVAQFAHLLDSAEHPRDRVLVALGLYLFLRQSEVRSLRVGDIDLDDGWMDVEIHKTSQRDRMPVSAELDTELRRWLTYYTQAAGPLDPTWCLVPARTTPKMASRPGERGFTHRIDDGPLLKPGVPLQQIERPIQAALVQAGFHIWDAKGKPNFEGMHTLRRSGARARFDALVQAGHDGAIREVQAMLHHASTQMTEHYLGLELDVDRRDKNIRGKVMFPGADTATVIAMPRRTASR